MPTLLRVQGSSPLPTERHTSAAAPLLHHLVFKIHRVIPPVYHILLLLPLKIPSLVLTSTKFITPFFWVLGMVNINDYYHKHNNNYRSKRKGYCFSQQKGVLLKKRSNF